jgi:hypothetical protein
MGLRRLLQGFKMVWQIFSTFSLNPYAVHIVPLVSHLLPIISEPVDDCFQLRGLPSMAGKWEIDMGC